MLVKFDFLKYDANGSLITQGRNDKMDSRTQYYYDFENRLTTITFNNGSYQVYKYNHAGKRMIVEKYIVNQSTPVGISYFVYDALRCNNVYEIHGTTVTRYVYMWPANEQICSLTSVLSSLTTTYFHCDALGSVIVTSNQQGNITGTFKYDPFGNVLESSGTSVVYGFIGSLGVRDDQQTGLSLMGHRYYDPLVGRFIKGKLL